MEAISVLSALPQALAAFLAGVSPPLPSDIGTQDPEKQSGGTHSDSFFSGPRSAVRYEGAESREGHGKRHLCQHLGREEKSSEGSPATFIFSPPRGPQPTF